MKIGLVDVDGHNFPNFALMKISAYHKAQGDTIEWFDPMFSHVDKIYASKVFSFTDDYAYYPSDTEIHKGGTGYYISSKLPDDIDAMCPDYTLYPQYDFAIGFLTRGCIRKCSHCIVPQKEGGLFLYDDIDKISENGKHKNVVLMDNNFLAMHEDFIKEQLLKAKKLKIKIDFNQSLDARLINENNAKLLAKTKWMNYIRLSCNNQDMLPVVSNSIKLLRRNGYNGHVFIYMLIKDNVQESLDRCNSLIAIDEDYHEHHGKSSRIKPFATIYRDFENKFNPTREIKLVARYINRPQIRESCSFDEFLSSYKDS